MFLADAVAAYVENLTEREFDTPFIALLHRLGFEKVHLVHGQYEFGKDFIARRIEDGKEIQYCFQSKAGDIGTAAWRELEKQVHAMRTGAVVHPGFDPSLERRLIIVVTGRLKGGAGHEFQSDNDYRRGRGEEPAVLWDLDVLVPSLEEAVVESSSAIQRARTLELLGRLGQSSCDRSTIAEFSTTWRESCSVKERWGNVLTCAVLAKEASEQGREDFAMQLAFQLLRSAWEGEDCDEDSAPHIRASARELFAALAENFWEAVRTVDPLDLTLRSASGIDTFATHSVMACRLAECLSLLGLHKMRFGDTEEARTIATYLGKFLAQTPGASHPLGDEWSFSLLALGAFYLRLDKATELADVLRSAAVWFLDRIEYGSGLAPVGAPPDKVVRQLLGPAYPSFQVHRRNALYGFAVVLDLLAISGAQELFGDLVHDLHSIEAYAQIVVPKAPGQADLIARIAYTREGNPPASHHGVPLSVMPAAQSGDFFDCLATWCTQRDRHLPTVLREFCRTK